MADEALAHVKMGQFLKGADRALADGRGMAFRHPLNDGGIVDWAPCGRQGRTLEIKRTGVNSGADETQKARYAYA